MANQIKIDVSQMGDVKIENKDGVVIITPVEKREGGLPEVGYWVNQHSEIVEIPGCDIMKDEIHRNVYPRKNHAIIVGQLLGPLLVKHWELTGGYWDKGCQYSVYYSTINKKWKTRDERLYDSGSRLGLLQFPFPNQELAKQFLEENKPQLNEISRLWQEG